MSFLAEKHIQLVAFLVGLVQQDIYLTLWIGLGGTALTFLLAVPPWPVYNRDPQPWLPATTSSNANTSGMSIEVDGKKVN